MSAGVTAFRSTAGSASGLMGAIQLLGASGGVFVTSRLAPGALLPLGCYVLAAAALGAIAFRVFLSPARRAERAAGAEHAAVAGESTVTAVGAPGVAVAAAGLQEAALE